MVENRILQSLTPDDFAWLRSRLVPVELKQHEVLYEQGAPIEHVYFPEAGLVSLLAINETGDAIETAIVSTEGIVGDVALLEAERSTSQVVVQIRGRALKLPTASFLEACDAIPHLKRLASLHTGLLLFQAQQNAVCHALHTVEGRLCRWMLQAQDVTKSNVLELTQEFLSHMLAAQRTSVSMIAHTLQQAGFIRYRRGRIEIVDRLGLEAASCECYSVIKQEIDARLPRVPTRQSA
jgi:CRP-like cAMP-binding protein